MSIQTGRNDEEKDYKTNEFGSPVDRNYHYRIPTDNDAAMRLASWALHGRVKYSDRVVSEWKGHSGDGISYLGIETRDNKGHLDGLAKYAHSPEWQNLGPISDIDEYRQNPSGAGAKVRGTFKCSPDGPHREITLEFDAVVDLTPTEFEAAYENAGDDWGSVQDTIHWAKQDAIEEYREELWEHRRDCEHEHFVEKDTLGRNRAIGYCEDCGAELDENGEIV
jgi:hypothetical protein